MKKIGIITCILLATLLLGCTGMSAEEIAKKMQEKYESIKDMKGTITVTTEFNGEKQTQTICFVMKMPDKHRSEDENTIVVSNGKTMWIYDKKKNEVIKMELPKVERPEFDYGELVKAMLEENDVKLIGTEKVSDRDCYVIEVIPKNETYYTKQKLWIDKEFWYPLKIEIISEKFRSTIEYQNVEFNTGVSDSEFEFTPPEGAKIVDNKFEIPRVLGLEEAQKQVNFTIVTPTYTAGYEFNHAMVFKFGERETVSLQYSKDGKIMRIRETIAGEKEQLPNSTAVKIKDVEGEFTEMFGIRLLRFNLDEIEIVISGKLDKEELIKIAESMIQ